MSCMSQNFRLFHVSNLSVRNFRIFLLMYPGSVYHPQLTHEFGGGGGADDRRQIWSDERHARLDVLVDAELLPVQL